MKTKLLMDRVDREFHRRVQQVRYVDVLEDCQTLLFCSTTRRSSSYFILQYLINDETIKILRYANINRVGKHDSR